jgi:hypothetical protein
LGGRDSFTRGEGHSVDAAISAPRISSSDFAQRLNGLIQLLQFGLHASALSMELTKY